MCARDVELRGAGYANTNGIGRFKELNLIMSNRYLGIFIQKLNNMKDSTRLLMGPKLTITPHPHLIRQDVQKVKGEDLCLLF